MCGISGIWSNFNNDEELKFELKKMAIELKHRGPDHLGFWSDAEHSFYLSHQRLSILDLSQAGNQPMISNSERYVISFNGEIYNFKQLRIEIEKEDKSIKWKGHSDTEVLLALIEKFGLKKTLLKCIGMFAIALWDRENKCLQLARDRIGEKPLYYGFCGPKSNQSFLFASELSSIKVFKYFDNSINREAVSELVNFQAISAPNSIFENIYQLLPGHLITINSPKYEHIQESESWWDLTSVIKQNFQKPILEENEAIEQVEKTLSEAVKLQSIADVSLGTFLSGGIDSSLITSLLQSQSTKKVKTFTIGFDESEFNEAPFSKVVAEHLNTEHTEIYLTSQDAQNLIPKLCDIYSEPFADSSQLPTHLVCKEAKKSGLTVALSGDGGDEFFGGYNRYFIGGKIWKKLKNLPWPVRKIIGEIGLKIPYKKEASYSNLFRIDQLGNKIYKLSERLRYIKNDDDFYYSLLTQWKDLNSILRNQVLDVNYLPYLLRKQLPFEIENDLVSKMMAYDSLNYLPNDILTKVDRAAMATSLETRAPFLDHRVIELSWRLNNRFKINNNKNFSKSNKWVLRQILYKYVPAEMIERPKAGFAIPIAKWLRGSLKQWTNDLISKEMIKKSGYFNEETVDMLWQDHLSNKRDNSSKLWPIIMMQSWLNKNKMI